MTAKVLKKNGLNAIFIKCRKLFELLLYWYNITIKLSQYKFQMKNMVIRFFLKKKIDELAIGRLQQTHQLQSSNPKDRIFQKCLKIASLGISGAYQH